MRGRLEVSGIAHWPAVVEGIKIEKCALMGYRVRRGCSEWELQGASLPMG